MDSQNLITLLVFVATLVVGLIAIIYANLNKKTETNSEEIKEINGKFDKFVTKDDYNREYDKLDAKLDKIIDILIGGN